LSCRKSHGRIEPPSSSERKEPVNQFKVGTFNVNSIRSRMPVVLSWLEKERPDILCMQETKVEDSKFPEADFRNAGYHVVCRGGKSYNGVAVASLSPPREVSFGFDDSGPADENRLIRAVFPAMTVINCYVPQGKDREHPDFAYKIEWFSRLRSLLDRHGSPGKPLLCCGDLNVAREKIDVHDPKRLLGHADFTPEVWKAFDFLCSWGLEDVFRKHHPGKAEEYTFFDYRVRGALERGLGWRVDHILATPPLAARSTGAWIDLEPRRAEKPSDHTVLVAEFEI